MHHRRRDDKLKRRKLREQPISRLFPNMITIAGLCCGLSAIRFAMLGRWEIVVGFILAAAIIDGMDGRVARMLGATSTFGAQLDSLSDFVCFGIAPAMVIYMWQLQDVRGIGWAVVLFFSVCAALRLARFNTGLYDDKQQPWQKQFFVGVPSPAAGILCLLPLFVSLQFGHQFSIPNAVIIVHMLVVGTLMASRIPTFSGKQLRIKHEYIPQFMIACSFLLVLFIIEPWMFIVGLSGVYLLSIIFSASQWKKLSAQDSDD
ncbi:MAG: CDP-diacylglycerol--serine O-phosphatidyltransferase [Rickettsiales bacterium]